MSSCDSDAEVLDMPLEVVLEEPDGVVHLRDDEDDQPEDDVQNFKQVSYL